MDMRRLIDLIREGAVARGEALGRGSFTLYRCTNPDEFWEAMHALGNNARAFVLPEAMFLWSAKVIHDEAQQVLEDGGASAAELDAMGGEEGRVEFFAPLGGSVLHVHHRSYLGRDEVAPIPRAITGPVRLRYVADLN